MKYLKTIKYLPAFLLAMVWSLAASAQAEPTVGQPEMADALRSNGKIYVVVTALVIIFIGIVIYLFALNAKLTKLEKLVRDSKK
jgi:CcmD family protein